MYTIDTTMYIEIKKLHATMFVEVILMRQYNIAQRARRVSQEERR